MRKHEPYAGLYLKYFITPRLKNGFNHQTLFAKVVRVTLNYVTEDYKNGMILETTIKMEKAEAHKDVIILKRIITGFICRKLCEVEFINIIVTAFMETLVRAN